MMQCLLQDVAEVTVFYMIVHCKHSYYRLS